MSHLLRLWHFFFLHKLILQTHMYSHPVGLHVWFLVGPFVYFHTSCVRTAKALARLRRCAGSPEPSLVTYVMSTIISWAGSNNLGGAVKQHQFFFGTLVFILINVPSLINTPTVFMGKGWPKFGCRTPQFLLIISPQKSFLRPNSNFTLGFWKLE